MIKYYNIMLVLWVVLTSLKLWISSITGGIGGETILESELTADGEPNGSTPPPPNGSPKPSNPSFKSSNKVFRAFLIIRNKTLWTFCINYLLTHQKSCNYFLILGVWEAKPTIFGSIIHPSCRILPTIILQYFFKNNWDKK